MTVSIRQPGKTNVSIPCIHTDVPLRTANKIQLIPWNPQIIPFQMYFISRCSCCWVGHSSRKGNTKH